MYFVYILLSLKDRRTYVGYTKDVRARLLEHNAGRVTATKHRIPFKIFLWNVSKRCKRQKRENYGGKAELAEIDLKKFSGH